MLTSKMRVPLQTLPAFRAVARLANLRAAAEELHLTHSAVSQQIKLLEEQLGFELFDRPGRRIVLNSAGEALLRSIEPALENWAPLCALRDWLLEELAKSERGLRMLEASKAAPSRGTIGVRKREPGHAPSPGALGASARVR